jgi:endonuclease III
MGEKLSEAIGPKELGVDLESKKESEIFKWFLACLLFGKPIQRKVAERTFFEFESRGLITPQAILEAGWDKLVEALDEGHYVRYDFSTADKLLEICEKLVNEYGSVSAIHASAKDKKDLVARLRSFGGIGPKTAELFLRGMAPIWPKAR